MLSYYLDFYPGYRDKVTMKTTRHESLGIYIYANPKNKREKEFNDIMTEKAEAIRCRRFESVVNERYDFFDHSKMNSDFLAYFKRVLKNKDPKWKFVYEHFKFFVDCPSQKWHGFPLLFLFGLKLTLILVCKSYTVLKEKLCNFH